ncbi:hypothetical protein L226DRAFT_613854 [Lentinus tigrinus ALCF2SS1-7]|uniref:uncharacterized protein n=1 Tax=Lentinus tigrinus ALCF2SS1-7 TaxID=1328758 RepID=UPI0011660355|nr:hypothetical protein L226DRAFT_613854 [Lentinus tigrinus ALCF2SS1-7]
MDLHHPPGTPPILDFSLTDKLLSPADARRIKWPIRYGPFPTSPVDNLLPSPEASPASSQTRPPSPTTVSRDASYRGAIFTGHIGPSGPTSATGSQRHLDLRVGGLPSCSTPVSSEQTAIASIITECVDPSYGIQSHLELTVISPTSLPRESISPDPATTTMAGYHHLTARSYTRQCYPGLLSTSLTYGPSQSMSVLYANPTLDSSPSSHRERRWTDHPAIQQYIDRLE